MTDYRLDIRDLTGALQYSLTDFTSLAYTRIVDAPGLLQFGVRGDHPMMTTIADKWHVEVWRKPEGQTWVHDFAAIYRDAEWTYTDQSRVMLICPGLMSMLGWRIVAWYAEVANRSFFDGVAAATIMKTLVSYNAGSLATVANGRKREGAITGLTIEFDAGTGTVNDWYCAYENLLTTLQKLALVAGGDFNVVKTSATAWQFRWYLGQLGTDRTATIKFALDLGNMAQPKYSTKRIGEATAAIVGGQGNLSAREIAIREGTNYNVVTNNIEMFVPATDVTYGNTPGLISRGNAKLAEVQSQPSFSFIALQTPSTRYRIHYFLGDLVTAENPFTGTMSTMKVERVSISLAADGTENINPEIATYTGQGGT